MKKTIIIFSILIICLIVFFNASTYSFYRGNLNIEAIVALAAIIFFFIGVILNKMSLQKRSIQQPKAAEYQKIKELKISNREFDVLLALSEDLTNKEIAEKLFISESTTKTHVSNLLSKLQVSKRTEAIKKAQILGIIKSK